MNTPWSSRPNRLWMRSRGQAGPRPLPRRSQALQKALPREGPGDQRWYRVSTPSVQWDRGCFLFEAEPTRMEGAVMQKRRFGPMIKRHLG